jgi:hypothetical protein
MSIETLLRDIQHDQAQRINELLIDRAVLMSSARLAAQYLADTGMPQLAATLRKVVDDIESRR